MDKLQHKPIEVQFQYAKIQEVGCSFDSSVLPSLEDFDYKKLNIEFGFKLELEEKENILILGLLVKYFYDGNNEQNKVLELITENHFRIIDLPKIIEVKENNEFLDKANILPTLIGLSISTLRGMLFIKTAGTVLANPPLPVINPTEILQSLITKSQKK